MSGGACDIVHFPQKNGVVSLYQIHSKTPRSDSLKHIPVFSFYCVSAHLRPRRESERSQSIRKASISVGNVNERRISVSDRHIYFKWKPASKTNTLVISLRCRIYCKSDFKRRRIECGRVFFFAFQNIFIKDCWIRFTTCE